MTISLDTNVVMRLFIKNDSSQSALAEHSLDTYDEVQISDIALIETIYGLAYHYELGREAAAHYVNKLFEHPKVSCNYALFQKALVYFVEHPKLSIEDCYLAVHAEESDALPLLTFDRKLAHQLPQTELLKV